MLTKIKPVTWIIITFLLSRLAYILAGVHFDSSGLDYSMQFADADLLRHNLLQTVFYDHSQPPLFNLYLGLVLKLFPGREAVVWNLSFMLGGLLLALSIYAVMVRLKVKPKLSLGLTLLFMCSPATVLYENFLFYSYFEATFLCLAVLWLHKFLTSNKLTDAFIFFSLLSLIVLTRSLFHFFWLVLVVGVILFYKRTHWKKVALVACLPVLVALSLYAKNYLVFGDFTSSSWFGMNISKVTTFAIPENERKAMIERGQLSNLALIYPFSVSADAFPTYLTQVKPSGVPILDQVLKSSGFTNFNNLAFIDIAHQYQHDALASLTSHPLDYLKNVVKAVFIYFRPSDDYGLVKVNASHIEFVDRLYNLLIFGQPVYGIDAQASVEDLIAINVGRVGFFIVIIFGIVIVYGLRLLLKLFTQKPLDLPLALTVLFIWFNLVYVSVVGNTLDIEENNRFRFAIDPLMLIMGGFCLSQWLIKRQGLKKVFLSKKSAQISDSTPVRV